ncbi:hypothetical protein LCGC14_3066030, partial [marine sediment metagenome]
AQPCGHARRFIYSDDEGTCYCTECARVADLEAENADLREQLREANVEASRLEMIVRNQDYTHQEEAVPGQVALGFHADVLRLLGVESSAQATDKIRRLTDALLAINESDVRHSTRAWMRAVVRRALAETGGE